MESAPELESKINACVKMVVMDCVVSILSLAKCWRSANATGAFQRKVVDNLLPGTTDLMMQKLSEFRDVFFLIFYCSVLK